MVVLTHYDKSVAVVNTYSAWGLTPFAAIPLAQAKAQARAKTPHQLQQHASMAAAREPMALDKLPRACDAQLSELDHKNFCAWKHRSSPSPSSPIASISFPLFQSPAVVPPIATSAAVYETLTPGELLCAAQTPARPS
jgi:hypothetical protein